MNKKVSLWMLGIAAMLASCSQDEVLQNTESSGMSTVTITAQVDNGMQTRATHDADDELQRCIVEVREAGSDEKGEVYEGTAGDGNYTFNLTLKAGQNYDFLFWADDNTSYNTDDGLNNITLTGDNPGIAYFGSLTDQPLSSGMTVTLTHAVAKVTLKTTGTLPTGKNVTVKGIPTYSAFDVKTGDVTGDFATKDFTAEYTEEVTNGEVSSFYILAPKDGTTADVTVSCDDEPATLSNVPLRMNYRTVLTGDITMINKVAGDITATIDGNWSDNDDQIFPQINLTNDVRLTAAMIESSITNKTLVITGDMQDEDFTTLKNYLQSHTDAVSTLNLEGCSIEAIPDNAMYINDSDESLKQITTLILPAGLKSIGSRAFYSTGITTLTLPEGLESIGLGAFSYGELTELTIPASVTSIGRNAFSYNNELSTVTFKGATPPSTMYPLMFPRSTNFRVPSGSKEAYVQKLSSTGGDESTWNSRISEY